MAEYTFPSINELSDSPDTSKYRSQELVSGQARDLEEMFASFGMEAKVLDCHYNSFALLMKVQLGTGVSQEAVRKLRKDIELHMEAPVDFQDGENEHVIQIAVKDINRPKIALKDIIGSHEFRDCASKLAFGAGVDLFGGKLIIDLEKIRNLLVVGVTGSGKSVFLGDLILSILYRARPDEVQFLFFDFKGVELPLFNDIPHLVRPSVKNAGDALAELQYLEKKAEKRIRMLEEVSVSSFGEYNRTQTEKIPAVILIVDEFMSLVEKKKTGKEFTRIVQFLATSAPLTGIHLVLSTQRPSREVITKEISEAIPHRVSFYVMGGVDSRIAINRTGAQRLLGSGDMIYVDINSEKGTHAQAAYVTDADIDRVIRFCKSQWEYMPDEHA